MRKKVIHLGFGFGTGKERFACGAKGKGYYTGAKKLVTCKRCKASFIYQHLASWS